MPLLVLAGSFFLPAATRLESERRVLTIYRRTNCRDAIISQRGKRTGVREADRMIRRERDEKERERETERHGERAGEGGERRRCEGRLGRHLPTARSVTETAVGDALDAAPQSLLLLPPSFAAPPRSPRLPSYLTRFVR